jgi:lantibiotic modifying enzyme
MEAALHIGEQLCTAAYWHGNRCNWVGRSTREVTAPGGPITPTVTALGPELYSGTAGVALFLAQLFAHSGFAPARKAAHGAIRQALSRTRDVPPQVRAGFHGGLVGIAYAAVRVGLCTETAGLVSEGLDIARRAVEPRHERQLLDVVSGIAGSLPALLWLARLPGGDVLLGPAEALAHELACAATTHDGVWRWDNDRACGPGMGSRPLCGAAHGASGMGLALIEAGAAFRRPEWIAGGIAAFAYEDRLFDADRGNWPDLRERAAGTYDRPADRPTFMLAWCHGAPGIGISRLRAWRLLPERRMQLLEGIRRAVGTTSAHLDIQPSSGDASPCHGWAGLAETLLYATDVLNEPEHTHQVRRVWRSALRSRSSHTWRCGVASGQYNPSLMLGYAGIGYALLRAAAVHRPPPPIALVEGVGRCEGAPTPVNEAGSA